MQRFAMTISVFIRGGNPNVRSLYGMIILAKSPYSTTEFLLAFSTKYTIET